MANTKKLSRPERKKAKRTSRLELKNMYAGLTRNSALNFLKPKKGSRRFWPKRKNPANNHHQLPCRSGITACRVGGHSLTE